MKLQTRWKDCDRSVAVEEAIQGKLSAFDKYDFLNDNVKVEIVYYSKIELFKARINVDVRGGKILRTEASDKNIYRSINLAIDKMEDQLRRTKTRYESKKNAKKTKSLKSHFNKDGTIRIV